MKSRLICEWILVSVLTQLIPLPVQIEAQKDVWETGGYLNNIESSIKTKDIRPRVNSRMNPFWSPPLDFNVWRQMPQLDYTAAVNGSQRWDHKLFKPKNFTQDLNRKNRLLSIFTVVRYNNDACLSSSGDNGTCYPPRECVRRGGAVNGPCARGYGACCVFTRSCGTSTNQNGTYFTHNKFPAAADGTGSCQISVYKSSWNVCQFRLDFVTFNLGQPNTNGICNSDQFIVSGTTSSVPIICGVNTGNHMHVDVPGDNNPIILSVITGGSNYPRSWKIKITQIRCGFLTRAPEGCLQYFRGVSGVIMSYNFDFTAGQQLSMQDYTACVRIERNFCGIRYSACSDGGNPAGQGNDPSQARSRSFSLTGQIGNGQAVGAVVGSDQCQTDWITIPCATTTGRATQSNGAVCVDRLCGDIFNSEGQGSTIQVPVYSYSRPFRIGYHTDGNENNDAGNRGVCLNYIQQPCTPLQ